MIRRNRKKYEENTKSIRSLLHIHRLRKKINLLANAVYITIKYICINKKNKKKKEILPFWNRQSKAILPGSGKSENEKRKTDGREKEGERGERVEEEKEKKKGTRLKHRVWVKRSVLGIIRESFENAQKARRAGRASPRENEQWRS